MANEPKKGGKASVSVAIPTDVQTLPPLPGKIRTPEDLRALSDAQIPALCGELRQVMIAQTTAHGGHLASNLGVVELTVAIHRIFNAPTDHIIFDVGHQCYVHKLLTGRAERFSTLRQPGGLSGFPKREESAYDAFGTGHASTSLSAALGFARADRLAGRDAYTVVVLGDGAFTGGMIHEALNNCDKHLRLIVILNENEMSISKNVGHFARNLAHLRARPGYFRTKSALERGLEHTPLVGKPLLHGLRRLKRSLKGSLYSESNYFERMGLSYFGPADGNDEATVENLLRMAKSKGTACLIHLKTQKGRGYAPAEKNPDAFHGLSVTESGARTFSEQLGEVLVRQAEENERICAITAAMPQGTGLSPFAARFPKRFFDVGIAEEHAVTFAAGLAANGCLPVVAIYSSFLQRAYDQILHDVALQKLPVLFCVDRAGLRAEDGPTHHGVYDAAFLTQMPHMTVFEPSCLASQERLLCRFLSEGVLTAPTAIRYPGGGECPEVARMWASAGDRERERGWISDFAEGAPPRTVVVSYGRQMARVLAAKQSARTSVGVVLMEQLSPAAACVAWLCSLVRTGTTRLIFCEESVRDGGVFKNLIADLVERLQEERLTIPSISLLAIRDVTVTAPAGGTLPDALGIGVNDIVRAIDG